MIKIKFRCDDPPHSIDSLIRDHFDIPNEITYRLVDVSDGSFVGLPLLSSLVDQTKILIKQWPPTTTASSSPQVIDSSARGIFMIFISYSMYFIFFRKYII
jgi:hypothetical protein